MLSGRLKAQLASRIGKTRTCQIILRSYDEVNQFYCSAEARNTQKSTTSKLTHHEPTKDWLFKGILATVEQKCVPISATFNLPIAFISEIIHE